MQGTSNGRELGFAVLTTGRFCPELPGRSCEFLCPRKRYVLHSSSGFWCTIHGSGVILCSCPASGLVVENITRKSMDVFDKLG